MLRLPTSWATDLGDILVTYGVFFLVYLFGFASENPADVTSVERFIYSLGGVVFLIHYIWMLRSAFQYTTYESNILWVIFVALTFYIGSGIFYFKKYRPAKKLERSLKNC